MTAFEIDLAKAYLAGTGQDPIAALIWAVKDLARARRSPPQRDLHCFEATADGSDGASTSPVDPSRSPIEPHLTAN